MHIFLIAAVTKDGFIARSKNDRSFDWTSPEDKQFFRDRTIQAGAIVMGSTTYQTIGHPLPHRLNVIYSTRPQNSTDPNLRFTQESPLKLSESLENEGYKELAICGGSRIYTMFLESGLVDTLYITEENISFGTGIPLFSSTKNIPEPTEIRVLSPKTTLKTIVLRHH